MTGVLVRETKKSTIEFESLLREALSERTIVQEDNGFVVDGGRIVIHLTQKEQESGSPLLLADFTFEGMSDEEVRAVMEHVDRAIADTV